MIIKYRIIQNKIFKISINEYMMSIKIDFGMLFETFKIPNIKLLRKVSRWKMQKCKI
jgi:hypothetical protein